MLSSLSAISADFPTVEVEWEDLLQYRYMPDGRGENGLIDCLGIVMEIFRRAGIGLPELKLGNAVDTFHQIFAEVETADTLYDVIHMASESGDGLFVVVRSGEALSIMPMAGVVKRKVLAIESRPGVTSYRVRPECLP